MLTTVPSGSDIRQGFFDFFAARGHQIVPSASIVPESDPSLLFTNAGMVQFKKIFLGAAEPSARRVANAQKCLRLSGKHNDLEQVGRDTYHHTLFEMLGNWSFGDYYKSDAIAWAWQLLTEVWQLPKDRLWATVYTTDDEAAAEWLEATDLPAARLLRFEEENFWEMGEAGPCGPCSEIHFDRGPGSCDLGDVAGHRCAVNAGCARYIELWNLVFIQYNRELDGTLRELPSKHVDTGMGLERVTAVLQDVASNYDTDLFRGIIAATEGLAKRRYGADPDQDVSFRVIADHARAVTVMIADHVLPSNEGRGYVLRRILRRAARHGKMLGLEGPFLTTLVDAVVATLGGAYPELRKRQAFVAEVVRTEESRFAETLDKGLTLLESEIARLPAGGTLPGEVAFRLYDTYGFPLDLTEDIVRGRGLAVDAAGFTRMMEEQRARAREAKKFVAMGGDADSRRSRFVGDRVYEWESTISAVARADGTAQPGGVHEGEIAELITEETPFYGESGGQVGDIGTIETERGDRLTVLDTLRPQVDLIVHRVRVERGSVAPGDVVRLRVDTVRREAVRLHHSATHLLHGVLRERLGEHVRQAGSLVAPDRLRFDFSHTGPIDGGELAAMEDEINARIRANVECVSSEMSYDEAMRLGALAFFGDKYGDRVRVIQMDEFSTELCGGTHVRRTGDIGLFKFHGESGVAAGVRRVEAASGRSALDWIQQREQRLRQIRDTLKASDEDAVERLERLLAEQRELERKLDKLQRGLAGAQSVDLAAQARTSDGIHVLATRVDDLDDKALRELADRLKEKLAPSVIALGTTDGAKVTLVAAVSKDLVKRFHAGNLIKQIAPLVGGGGGGRPDFAQAGGKDPTRLDEALAKVYELVG
jgi:alanyl-tRNA synthetase